MNFGKVLFLRSSQFAIYNSIELIGYLLFFSAEAGDYIEEEHKGNYINDIKLLPRQVSGLFLLKTLTLLKALSED